MSGQVEIALEYTDFDIEMTRRSLELAASGKGQVSPGPLVGCVIVSSDGEISGEGAYFFERTTHAEVIALKEAGEAAHGGTAYISLEPHSHHGRTPPCTDALLDAGIKRVVVPIEDPNPLVSGRGFKLLQDKGVEVVTGILKDEAELQNEKFINWHKNKRPFVHLKLASSLDGKCATRTGESKWITGEESRAAGQEFRHEHDAILVGVNTVNGDDPGLTYRGGKNKRKPLVRIVLDSELRTDPDSQVVISGDNPGTVIFCSENAPPEREKVLSANGSEVIRIGEGPKDLAAVLQELYMREIQSVLVEGGPTVAASFLEQRLVDKVTFFLAPMLIGGNESLNAVGGSGVDSLAEALRLKNVAVSQRGTDVEVTGYPEN